MIMVGNTITVKKHLTSSLIIYFGESQTSCAFSMGLDPTKLQDVKDLIDRKKKSLEIIWFLDSQGLPHAAIDSQYLIDVQEGVRLYNPKVVPVDSKLQIGYDLYYRNGEVKTLDSTYGYLKSMLSSLSSDIQHGHCKPKEDSDLIGYNSYILSDCACSTQKLMTTGCSSAKGKRCDSSTTPQRWKA